MCLQIASDVPLSCTPDKVKHRFFILVLDLLKIRKNVSSDDIACLFNEMIVFNMLTVLLISPILHAIGLMHDTV